MAPSLPARQSGLLRARRMSLSRPSRDQSRYPTAYLLGSQTETTWISGAARRGGSSRRPSVPVPMWARVILSLGGISPERASSRRGRMVKAAAPAAVPRNLRRLEWLDICLLETAHAAADAGARSY